MFSHAMNVQNAYRSAGVDAEILGSSPHRLIKLLFDGALAYIAKARQHMLDNNVQAKSEAITRAIDIISRGLRASLDLEAGGQLAKSLDDLYEYIALQVLKGQMQNDPACLDEASRLLTELGDAWAQIGDRVGQ
ncbi:flagellar export chaperone FliS [Thauera sp. CAU 1555]|uniref:Flagellar secretion chaperone FliS n=1 Tax=Thauera sedimentorum TaxID=2767595 RepID=A0ABR9B6D7_9RHOO|nr:flagellar export chaperone FliS [Thauera sedimentorum]MBC9070827.1 flagellar export chaperone FliS [Thauera sedimentorum]MBD8501746.1 flagellar export chaperone FliS [Thauera sedimentorum]